MVEIGIKGKQEALVSEDLTAKHIGSGTVLVLFCFNEGRVRLLM